MFRFALRLIVLMGAVVVSAALLAAAPPREMAATSVNAGWEEMGIGSASGGGISNNSGSSDNPSLAISDAGMPIVAWSDDSSGNHEIYVRRWNGSAWVEMGSGSASGGGISGNPGNSTSPSLAIGPDGAPVIAWQNFFEFYETGYNAIYVRRWNGSAWVEVGDSASGVGISGSDAANPSLAIGPDGAPIVAWHNTAPDDDSRADREGIYGEIYVRRWNGSAWEEVGDSSASGSGISKKDSSWNPALAIGSDGLPIVVWAVDENSLVYVRRWDGVSWAEMGSGSASGDGIGSGHAAYPAIEITPDGMPVVAWSSSDIQLRSWDGSSWLEMPSPAATNLKHTSLAVAADGALIVAWESTDFSNSEIYVRRWDGSMWVEIDSGSASRGGISDSGGWAEAPDLAINLHGSPVIAWNDEISHGNEIYVRRYQYCRPASLIRAGQRSVSVGSPTQAIQRIFLPTVLHVLHSYAESEPNNDAAQANGPLCSGRAYLGLPNDRYDVFALDADAGLVMAELTNHTGSGVQLQLHHQAITPNPIAIDYTGADGYRVALPNAPAGRYYIVISTQTPDPAATTRYTLTTTFNMSR